MTRPDLSAVTLCAATSVNLAATLAALRRSRTAADFGECLLFTDAVVDEPRDGIRIVPIARLGSASDYSRFILRELADHVATPHCLVIQWDGFVLDAGRWEEGFLDFDYIGAPWPQFDDGHVVGNGGFSLRSRTLLEACRDPELEGGHPEDLAICRTNRAMLERRHGIRFADAATAARFAFERGVPDGPTFGFHGIFNMSNDLGVDGFWDVYETLDDRRSAFVDYWLLMRELGRGRDAWSRRWKLTRDRLTRR